MLFLIASALIFSSATYSEEFRNLIKSNSWHAILKIMEYYTYIYNKIYPRKLKNCCSINSIHYLVFNKKLNKIIHKIEMDNKNINFINQNIDKTNLKNRIFQFMNSSYQDKFSENPSYLLFNYNFHRNQNDEFYKFIVDITEFSRKKNDKKDELDKEDKQDKENKEDNYSEETLKFLDSKIIEDNLDKSILSCNYNDDDITELINSYIGPNKDFFNSNIDFRVLLDDNLNQIYSEYENEINIIYGSLDLNEINLDKIDYNCHNLLKK